MASQIRAVQTGEQGNRLSGEAELIDPLFWVESVQVPIETTNGVDGQTLEEYLESLISLMRIVALRPILPLDYAILALRVPGVARAVAMDGYDPGTETWGHARMVTLILTNDEGLPVSTAHTDQRSDDARAAARGELHRQRDRREVRHDQRHL